MEAKVIRKGTTILETLRLKGYRPFRKIGFRKRKVLWVFRHRDRPVLALWDGKGTPELGVHSASSETLARLQAAEMIATTVHEFNWPYSVSGRTLDMFELDLVARWMEGTIWVAKDGSLRACLTALEGREFLLTDNGGELNVAEIIMAGGKETFVDHGEGSSVPYCTDPHTDEEALGTWLKHRIFTGGLAGIDWSLRGYNKELSWKQL